MQNRCHPINPCPPVRINNVQDNTLVNLVTNLSLLQTAFNNSLGKVKVNSGDTFDYLIDQIDVQSPEEIITSWSVVNGKARLNLSINYELLASKLSVNSFVCPNLSNVVLTKLSNSSVSVSYITNNSGSTFKYSIDGGSNILITSNPFTITGLSAASHTITVNAIRPDNTICATDNDTIDLSIVTNTGYVGYSTTNPFPGMTDDEVISAGVAPIFTQLSSITFNNNADIVGDFHTAPTQIYAVFKYPATEPTKTTWVDTGAFTGAATFPDNAFRATFTVGGFKYVVGRTAIDFDTQSSSRVILS